MVDQNLAEERRRLERLIHETARESRRVLVLAERVLLEMNAVRLNGHRCERKSVNEADAEPAWRLAA